jgi:UDP-3-O-[3-hydroxymyristoyl] glucosamine N-acyltransferase
MSAAKKSWSVNELAAACGGRVVGDGERLVVNIVPLDEATPEDISYLSDRRWAKHLESTRAGTVILKDEQEGAAYTQVIAEDPYLAYARVAAVIEAELYPRAEIGVAEGALVAESASLGAGCSIYPGAQVGERTRLGKNVTLHGGAYVGEDCEIGDDTTIFPNAVVYSRCKVGRRVRIHACAVIGNDGYGFTPDAEKKLVKIPQLGWVEIGDDVEIGSCSTVHRGALGPTRVGRRSKLDAMVVVAHNVQVGEDVRLVAQVGIAGSCEIGDRCVVAGQAAMAGHNRLVADVVLGARAATAVDIKKPGLYLGAPAMPIERARRVLMTTTRLPEMRQKLRDLEKRLAKLEKSASG